MMKTVFQNLASVDNFSRPYSLFPESCIVALDLIWPLEYFKALFSCLMYVIGISAVRARWKRDKAPSLIDFYCRFFYVPTKTNFIISLIQEDTELTVQIGT